MVKDAAASANSLIHKRSPNKSVKIESQSQGFRTSAAAEDAAPEDTASSHFAWSSSSRSCDKSGEKGGTADESKQFRAVRDRRWTAAPGFTALSIIITEE